jgi:phosphoenolpyruvate carboxylase
MFSRYSKIDSIQLFDCEYIEQCWECKQVCYKGLQIKLRYKFDMLEAKNQVSLCRKHALQAIKSNAVDLPLDTCEFLFSRKYSQVRQEYLSKLNDMEELTPKSLSDSFHSGEIHYWHESSSEELDQSLYTAKSLKTIESVSGKIQAVVYQNSEQRFQIRYYYQNYIELGEWDWRRECTDEVTLASDIKSAIRIALIEIAYRLKQPVVQP